MKLPDNITSNIISNTLLKQQQVKITGRFLPTDGRYKEVINKTISFSFIFPRNTEISRLYLFPSPGEKIQTIYKLEE